MKVYEALRIVKQGSDGVPDCAISTLATLLGTGYEKTLAAALQTNKRVLQTGLSTTNIQRAAKKLGQPLKAFNPSEYDLDEAVGILEVIGNNHVVIVVKGVIFDLREPSIWPEADVFFSHYRARPGKLLTEE